MGRLSLGVSRMMRQRIVPRDGGRIVESVAPMGFARTPHQR